MSRGLAERRKGNMKGKEGGTNLSKDRLDLACAILQRGGERNKKGKIGACTQGVPGFLA